MEPSASDLAVQLRLRFDEQTVTGQVEPPDGSPVAFKGWLGLLGVLEGLRDGDPPTWDGPPPADGLSGAAGS